MSSTYAVSRTHAMSSAQGRLHCRPQPDFPSVRAICVSALLAPGLFGIATSHAQTVAHGEGQRSADIEEIVVTGSHIAMSPSQFEGRAPLQVLDGSRLEASGVSQMQEALRDITVNTGSQLVNEQNTRAGVSQFSLRGLGLGSTLTLVNGRRAGVSPVADATGTDFLDINQFPVSMIERVEVLTDGASATYGSEAVAGVVNIITRSKFEGFELSADYRDASNESYAINAALGGAYDQGRFSLFASYYTQTRNHRTDFPWLVDRIHGGGDLQLSNLISGQGAPGTYLRGMLNTSGQAESFSGARNFADPDCEAAGGVFQRNPATGVVDRSVCRFDFADQRAVIPAEQRIQLFTQINHEFTDSLELFGELSFSQNTVRDTLGGFTYGTGSVVGANAGAVYIPANHPFNFFVADPNDPRQLVYRGPQQWQPGVDQAVPLVCLCRPLGKEVNGENRTGDIVRDFRYLRTMAGLKFDLFEDWSGTVYHSYANGRIVETTPHNYNADLFNGLVATGQWNPFGTRLTDPDLRTPKDAVLDGLDPLASVQAGNSPEALQQFDGTAVSSAVTKQNVTEAVASGELFELGSRPVGAAIGGQFRRLALTDDPDSLDAAGEGNEPFQQFTVSGKQDVWAIFAETLVPLGEHVDVQLAARHENYGGSVGATTDPKISAEIRPAQWLSLRGSWGTSFQAPTIRQIEGTTANSSLNDPASISPLTGQLECVRRGVVQNVIVKVAGSDELKPQNAGNFNTGIVLRPLDGLQFSADYWDYSYEDLISQDSSPQAIVDRDCADDGIPNDPRITRNGAGQLRVVRDQIVNVGRVETNGVDLALAYGREAGVLGFLSFDARATYINKFDVFRASGSAAVDQRGSRNATNGFAPTPKWRANASLSWAKDIHSANATVRYIDSYANDQNASPVFGIPQIKSFTTVDLQYQIALSGLINDQETVFAIGANNLFDVDPPALPMFGASGNVIQGGVRPGYDGEVHDIRGRVLYVRFAQSF